MEDSERRQKLAELKLLEMYDELRSAAGHDYGSGQRDAELIRRRRELGGDWSTFPATPRIDTDDVTDEELAQAYSRIGRPRLTRVELETYRRETPASRRTLGTWKRIERRVKLAERDGVVIDAETNARLRESQESSIEEVSAAARQDVSASIERRRGSDDPILVREKTETERAAFVVYGLRDWQPHAIACRSCSDHVFSIVHGAYGNPTDPELDCELAYEGICDQGPEADR